MNADILSVQLFGNEAAEDEDIAVLTSYFVEKAQFAPCYDPSMRFQVVRSRKGLGKSALLKRAFSEASAREDTIALYLKGSDLIALQQVDCSNPHTLTYGWQQRMCSRVTLELGQRLRVALDDDSITLVESAELAGFRGRNLVGSLLDRVKFKLKSAQMDISKLVPEDKEQVLKRFSRKKNITVWLFIDDIDATFLNRDDQRLLISTFFSACRNLVNDVQGLLIRASVRTDVWSILAQHDEALDKCEQYMIDINWSTRETGMILKKKIVSYFQRTYPDNPTYQTLDPEDDEKPLFSLVSGLLQSRTIGVEKW